MRFTSHGYGRLEMLQQCHLQSGKLGQHRYSPGRVKSRESGKPVLLLTLEDESVRNRKPGFKIFKLKSRKPGHLVLQGESKYMPHFKRRVISLMLDLPVYLDFKGIIWNPFALVFALLLIQMLTSYRNTLKKAPRNISPNKDNVICRLHEFEHPLCRILNYNFGAMNSSPQVHKHELI